MSWKIKKNQEMFEHIKENLITYLKKGHLSTDSFAQKLNLNIDNLKELIEIHFIFDELIINFVNLLPEHIRNIKTSVVKKENLYKYVKGKVDWHQTLIYRTKNNNSDPTNFVCSSNNINYNIQENIVLKKTLEIIDDIIINNQQILENNKLNWNNNWLSSSNMYKKFKTIYNKNIYINRISLENMEISNRMILNTKKSRNIIYKNAANILEIYRKITNPYKWDKSTERIILRIFEKTLIHPENENVLFELYCVFYLIKKHGNNPKFYIMDGKNNLVASWKNEHKKYEIYHDSSGPAEISFNVSKNEIINSKNLYLIQILKVLNNYNEILEKNNNNLKKSLWDGRPDIILIERNTFGKVNKIFIGEIKYTINENYILKGLYELLEYIYLLKINQSYVYSKKIIGLLFSCNNSFNDWKFDADSIKHISF